MSNPGMLFSVMRAIIAAAVDVEVLRHRAVQSFNADVSSEAARVDGDV